MLSFIPKIEFSLGEITALSERMKDPIIVKYLTMIVSIEAVDLLTNAEPREGETAEAFLRRQAAVRGRIEAIEALLSIANKEPDEGDGNLAG